VLYEDQDDDDSEEPNSEEEEEDDEVPTSEDERSSAGSEKEIKLTAGKTNGQLATKDLGAPPEKTLSSSSLDNCSCKEKEKSKVTDYLEAQRDFVANNGVFEHNGSYAIPGAGSPSPKWASAKGDSPEMDTSPWINPAAAAQSSKDSDDADMSSKGTTSKGRLVLKNEGWKMVIVARQDLGMSAGKIGAQVFVFFRFFPYYLQHYSIVRQCTFVGYVTRRSAAYTQFFTQKKNRGWARRAHVRPKIEKEFREDMGKAG